MPDTKPKNLTAILASEIVPLDLGVVTDIDTGVDGTDKKMVASEWGKVVASDFDLMQFVSGITDGTLLTSISRNTNRVITTATVNFENGATAGIYTMLTVNSIRPWLVDSWKFTYPDFPGGTRTVTVTYTRDATWSDVTSTAIAFS